MTFAELGVADNPLAAAAECFLMGVAYQRYRQRVQVEWLYWPGGRNGRGNYRRVDLGPS